MKPASSLLSLSWSLLPLAMRRVPSWSGDGPLPSLSASSVLVADGDWLRRYRAVVGAVDDGVLPPCAPQVLAAPLHREIMMAPSFPFAAIGLVHIGNTIVEHQPVAADAKLELHTRLDGHQPHAKGIAFRITTDAVVGGQLAWTSTMTVLSRRAVLASPAVSTVASDDAGPCLSSSVLRVPADQGRRYAVIAGDANPIHLSTISARPFGFRRAIAHGMWTLARSLAEVSSSLPTVPRITEIRFIRPVLLPSKAVVTLHANASGEGRQLMVRAIAEGPPHLVGTISRNVG